MAYGSSISYDTLFYLSKVNDLNSLEVFVVALTTPDFDLFSLYYLLCYLIAFFGSFTSSNTSRRSNFTIVLSSNYYIGSLVKSTITLDG